MEAILLLYAGLLNNTSRDNDATYSAYGGSGNTGKRSQYNVGSFTRKSMKTQCHKPDRRRRLRSSM